MVEKTFNSVKVGSYLEIYKSTGTSKFSDYIVKVTYVEVHGDYLRISFKNSKFNHTITVYKHSTNAWVYVCGRNWYNCRTACPYLFSKECLKERNSSIRQFKINYTYKYNYLIRPI